MLRTWRDPWWLPDNRTFVGLDLFVWPVFFLGPRVGVYRPITGATNGGWFFTVDFGFGL